MALEVGQKLYYVERRRGSQPRWITITKVGRKWAEIDGGRLRLDIATLNADGAGYTSPGKAYVSQEVYDAEVNLRRKWGEFSQAVSHTYSPPKHLSEADIDSLLRTLRAPLSGDKQ